MYNFFKDLNNRVRPISQGNNKFFLRIITERETIEANPKIIDMLNRLMYECEQDLKKSLEKNGDKLKEEHKANEMWQVSDSWLQENFVDNDNRMMFVMEDEKHNPISVAIGFVDDKETRKLLQVPEDVGTFFYVPRTITEEAYKNSGIASLMLDKAMTMFQKRNSAKPILASTSVNIAPIIKNDGSEFNEVMNLPRYVMMWSQKFENNYIQVKHRNLQTLIQEGKQLFDFDDITTNGKYDNKKVNQIIKKEYPQEGWEMRGFFVIGELTKSYPENKEIRKARAEKFVNNFIQPKL